MKKVIVIVVVLLLLGVVLLPVIMGMAADKALTPANQGKDWAPSTAYNAGLINMRYLQFDRALGILGKTYEAWPQEHFHDECHYKIAMCYEQTGELEKAISWYRSFRGQYPDHRWADQAQKRITNIQANM